MSRYFIELAYRGTQYSGFQIQQNAPTIQLEVEKAISTLQRQAIKFTGSSRTDAGVHALQNYFHFDLEGELNGKLVYQMNAILPADIVVKSIQLMTPLAHARFDALSRCYCYRVHRFKNPFIRDTSFYYPYQLDMGKMEVAAAMVRAHTHFFAFSKTHSQVKTYQCIVKESGWDIKDDMWCYRIEANRFLRGMVRMLTASMLKVGRGQLKIIEFGALLEGDQKCMHSVPAHGLFLEAVKFPENFFGSVLE